MSCSILSRELEISRNHNHMLLDTISQLSKPQPVVASIPEVRAQDYKPTNQILPWHVQQRMLEAEDRVKAAKMRQAAEAEAFSKAAKITTVAPSGGQVATIPFISNPTQEDSILALEKELGISEEVK